MNSKNILQMKPWYGIEEKNAIAEYLSEDVFITEYKKTKEFEEIIADYVGVKHCIVVNNGTISLTLASLACGISPGDEVIVPNYTMVATPNSVKMFGAKPIFVDVEEDTLCLDFNKAADAISSKTKAIILVSANGRFSKNINEFKNLCNNKNIFLIEDAAQSLGSYYSDFKHVGTAGIAGSFSFSSAKIISTGQGGAIVTNNDEINAKVRKLKDFGRETGGNDIHDTIGYNFKFTDLQAVLGIEQMKKLEFRKKLKKNIYKKYKNLLQGISQVSLYEADLTYNTPWFIDTIVEDRENLINYLKKNNIFTRPMYPPLNKQKAYNSPGNFKISNAVGDNGLWLPSYSQISDNEINTVCETISNFYNNEKK